ncbi:MAG: hypothetical protein V5A72_03050 [Candidatus Nanohaloarchaea archaeon]
MGLKSTVILVILLMLTTLSSGQLEFKTEEPIDFYSSQDLNENDLINLSEIRQGETTNLKLKDNGDINIPEGRIFSQRGAELNGNLVINRGGDGVILNGTETDHTYLEWYVNSTNPDNRSAWFGYPDASSTDLALKNTLGDLIDLRDADVRIYSGKLDMNSNPIMNLPSPTDPSEAVRKLFVESNFVSVDGDTMLGDLDMNGNNLTDVGYINMTSGIEIQGDIDTSGGEISTEGGNIILNGGYLSNDGDNEGISVDNSGNVQVPSGNLGVSGTTDSVDLDNPGNAISINSNQYVIPSGVIGSDELASNAVTSSGGELDSSVAGNQLNLNSGSLGVVEGSGSDLDADLLDGVQLSNINWSDVAMQQSDVSPSDVNLNTLTPGTGISGSGYDGTTARTWSVDWSAANDLNSGGGISDFSNAGDLGTGGDILDGNVENAELANSAITVSSGSHLTGGGSVSLGGSTTLNVDASSVLSSGNDIDGSGNVNHGLGATLNDGSSANQNIDMSGNAIIFGAASNAAPPTGAIKDVGYVSLENQEDQDLPTDSQYTLFADHSEGLQYNDNNHNDYVIASKTWVNSNDANNHDDQNLGYNNLNSPTGNYATHEVTITEGSNTNIRDYYESDTDTNAATECSNSQSIYLDGSGNCQDLSVNSASYINGDLITSNSIDSGEIDVSTISHDSISGVSYNDHHGLGDDLSWDGSNNPQLSNTVDVTGKMVIPVGNDAGL